MYTKLKFVILQLDDSSFYCLDQEGLPSTDLEIDLDGTIKSLLTEYLETDTMWIDYQLVDLRSFGEELHIYYTCLIPSIIQLKKGRWTNVMEFNEQDQEIIFEAIRRQVR